MMIVKLLRKIISVRDLNESPGHLVIAYITVHLKFVDTLKLKLSLICVPISVSDHDKTVIVRHRLIVYTQAGGVTTKLMVHYKLMVDGQNGLC